MTTMAKSVPVAANLLDSKLMGFSARRLAESMAIPLAPCAIFHTLNFPLVLTLPLFVGGAVTGITVYRRTPQGQQPLAWTLAILRQKTGDNVYTWEQPGASEQDLATGVTQDEWLTRDVPPHVSRLETASAAVETTLQSSDEASATTDDAVVMKGGSDAE
ncbi:hypothetical protein ACOZ4N_00930 (plasmid) [Halorientalis pallida]|uniref:hypothetical protein n=1 Tax=Halorientalis pallida TaxID=2479928 RepID=UPI003C6FFCD6